MSKSFIRLDDDHGFWCRDRLLLLWLWLVADELEQDPAGDDLDALVEEWRATATRHVGGAADLRLAFWAPDQIRRDRLRRAGEQAAARYERAPISGDRLQSIGIEGSAGGRPPDLQRINAIAARWDELLSGRIETTAADSSVL